MNGLGCHFLMILSCVLPNRYQETETETSTSNNKHIAKKHRKQTEKNMMRLSWSCLSLSNQQQQFRRFKITTHRLFAVTFLFSISFFLFSPQIPRSLKYHQFADLRNFIGVPNTVNVITNFPFLVVGVLGLVLTLEGGFFTISSQAETWAWILFYVGITGVAFGSVYYHLKPDNNRVLWDTLPMMVAYSSLFSSLVVERIGQRIGFCCMCTLLVAAFTSVVYERWLQSLRGYSALLDVPVSSSFSYCSSSIFVSLQLYSLKILVFINRNLSASKI
ncbi:uncharacterized protein LOC131596399 isoform X3 [Vicia villosa]|uniref:uncharacterized protein LOC131596399 isoform X3 n=1 Tax=Vicia villosa TaxID=3911 RepID=UPI00273C8ABC|nr:uncharacterized protein LOC131596399 isoform X3 [Vicia villosa]